MNKRTLKRIEKLKEEGLPHVNCIEIVITLAKSPSEAAGHIMQFIHKHGLKEPDKEFLND